MIRNILSNVISEHKHKHAFRFQGTSALTWWKMKSGISSSEGIRTGVTWIVGRAEQTNRAKLSPSH